MNSNIDDKNVSWVYRVWFNEDDLKEIESVMSKIGYHLYPYTEDGLMFVQILSNLEVDELKSLSDKILTIDIIETIEDKNGLDEIDERPSEEES